MTNSKLWNDLSYVVLGISIFEVTSRFINHLENFHQEYTSLRYLVSYVLTILGLCIAVSYILRIYIKVIKKSPNLTFNPRENVDLTFFRLFFQAIKELYKIVKQRLRHFTNYLIKRETKMLEKLRRFWRNTKAVSASSVVNIAVSALLVAILVPIALNQIGATNTSNMTTAVVTVFTVVLPILIVVGLAIKYVPGARK